MRHAFFNLASFIGTQLRETEQFTAWLSGEDSDFVRFNHARVRQAGHVQQAFLTLRLIRGQRHVSAQMSLTGESVGDRTLVAEQLPILRAQLLDVAEDPHLLWSQEALEATSTHESVPLDAAAIAAEIVEAALGYDLVGYLASGQMYTGFASSTGSRMWHQTASFNLNWSLYAQADKAVKCAYAGHTWNSSLFREKMQNAARELRLLNLPPRTLEPGEYRAFLTPTALAEVLGMLNWGGLSEKQLRVKRSPLLKLHSREAQFSPLLYLTENTADGLSPQFQPDGFQKPGQVPLIDQGQAVGTLIAPRTAMEYGLQPNSDSAESTETLHVRGGTLRESEILQALGTGLYVSNLWYLNFSDRMNARVTGMTRFATFWVENGEIVAPVNVMRFDDSLFRMLGDQLEALTLERELLVDNDTYGSRHTTSLLLPGALLRSLRLVL